MRQESNICGWEGSYRYTIFFSPILRIWRESTDTEPRRRIFPDIEEIEDDDDYEYPDDDDDEYPDDDGDEYCYEPENFDYYCEPDYS